jgi:hypothetical protein
MNGCVGHNQDTSRWCRGIHSFAFYNNTRQSSIPTQTRKMFEGETRMEPGMREDATAIFR